MIKIIPVFAIAGLLIAALLYRGGGEQEIEQNEEETDELREERVKAEIAALKLKKVRLAEEAVVGKEVMSSLKTDLIWKAEIYKKQFNKPLPICEQCSELEYMLILKRAAETENAGIEEQRNELYNLKKGKIVTENELENVETEYKKKFGKLIPWWWVCSDEEHLMRLKKALETNTPYDYYSDIKGYDHLKDYALYERGIAMAEYEMRFKKLPPECHCSDKKHLEGLEIALETGMPYPTGEEDDELKIKLKNEYEKKFGKQINDSELLTASIYFSIGGFPDIIRTLRIMRTSTGAIAKVKYEPEINIDITEWLDFVNSFYNLNNKWKERYSNKGILDGTGWNLSIFFLDKDNKLKLFRFSGSNAYPENWGEFTKIMEKIVGTNDLIKKMGKRKPARGRNFKK